MGQIKQMHIDCEPGDCHVPALIELCYMQYEDID